MMSPALLLRCQTLHAMLSPPNNISINSHGLGFDATGIYDWQRECASRKMQDQNLLPPAAALMQMPPGGPRLAPYQQHSPNYYGSDTPSRATNGPINDGDMNHSLYLKQPSPGLHTRPGGLTYYRPAGGGYNQHVHNGPGLGMFAMQKERQRVDLGLNVPGGARDILVPPPFNVNHPFGGPAYPELPQHP